MSVHFIVQTFNKGVPDNVCVCLCLRVCRADSQRWRSPAQPQCVSPVPDALVLLCSLLPEPRPWDVCLRGSHLPLGRERHLPRGQVILWVAITQPTASSIALALKRPIHSVFGSLFFFFLHTFVGYSLTPKVPCRSTQNTTQGNISILYTFIKTIINYCICVIYIYIYIYKYSDPLRWHSMSKTWLESTCGKSISLDKICKWIRSHTACQYTSISTGAQTMFSSFSF